MEELLLNEIVLNSFNNSIILSFLLGRNQSVFYSTIYSNNILKKTYLKLYVIWILKCNYWWIDISKSTCTCGKIDRKYNVQKANSRKLNKKMFAVQNISP